MVVNMKGFSVPSGFHSKHNHKDMMNIARNIALLTLTSLALVLTGCASKPSKPEIPEPTLSIASVLTSPEQYMGQRIHWGGTITKVENKAETTRIEIVSRELQKKGRPKSNDKTAGRFIAVFDEFLDPGVYTKDRQISVRGKAAGAENGEIGDYVYTYPLVSVDTHTLWKPAVKPTHYYDPLWDHWYYQPYFYRRHYDPFNPYSFYY
jgi:outer membrane lipoprotein